MSPVFSLLKGKHWVDSENIDNEEAKQAQAHDAPYGDDYRADEQDYFKGGQVKEIARLDDVEWSAKE